MAEKYLKVIVSCSGKFHAFALSEQLERFGALEMFYTSYSSIKNPLAKYLVSRRDNELISVGKIKTCLLIAFGIKLYNKPFFWNELFDKWVARKIRKSNANVFIGWSGMSLHSIKAAKERGMITILERGSSHIIHQLGILREEYSLFKMKFPYNKAIELRECNEYNEVDYISVPSLFAKNTFLKFGFNKDKLVLNHYGVSNFFKPICVPNDKKFYILFLGKISLQKGIVYLINAINILHSEGLNIGAIFVGAIDVTMKAVLEDLKTHEIQFLGHRNHYELSHFISKSSIAVVPSIQDGFAMVVPQILACNIPVIVSENTGAADIIVEGKNGFIVPIRDSKSIADKIKILYDNPDQLSEMKKFIANNPMNLSWEYYGVRYFDNLVKMCENE
jgi:glycosyltransferase involved in cell wall biosynthesis